MIARADPSQKKKLSPPFNLSIMKPFSVGVEASVSPTGVFDYFEAKWSLVLFSTLEMKDSSSVSLGGVDTPGSVMTPALSGVVTHSTLKAHTIDFDSL